MGVKLFSLISLHKHYTFNKLINKTNLYHKMKHLIIYIATLLLINLNVYPQIPYNQRYKAEVFPEISVTSDIVYGNAPALNFPYLNENNTSPQDLLMDIYLPENDTLQYRPTVICAHSGAFVSGSKTADDMVAFCDSLAHRGYVAVSIDYRLGMNVFSSSSSIRAVYRGIQDGRAAVRFLKEYCDTYGIDTNNIYILGSSAGAFIALHNLYMDTEEERPPETFTAPDLGCLDCSGNNYNHNGKSNGIVSLWGAVNDTNIIVSTDTLPAFLVHGTADATVPFGYGSPFGNSYFPATFGSQLITQQLTSFGHAPETYFVFGAGHEFYGTSNGNWNPAPNAYWDTVFSKTTNFFYDIHKPKTGYWLTQFENVVVIYDSSQNATSWYWDFGDGYISTEQNPSHEYGTSGNYLITQFVMNDLTSWDTLSVRVDISVGTKEHENRALKVYPNPANDFVNIISKEKITRIKIFNESGIKVFEQSFDSKKIKIRTQNFPEGLYIIETENKFGTEIKTKFIKR